MGFSFEFKRFQTPIFYGLVIILFWIILNLKLADVVIGFFRTYSFVLFLLIFVLYFVTFRMSGQKSVVMGLGLTFILFALALAYKWQSGFSDNFLIGGLLPYKDAKNYFLGANLILNGMPLEQAGQATERPLFPSFFSSLLFLTRQNLKISIAILVQLAGIGLYISSRRIFHSFGPVAGSLYISLLYFYIQPWTGYMMSEMYGFMMGCIAFTLLWSAAENSNKSDLLIGLIILLIAVNARAGTFIIFPLLAVWAGWVFRGKNRFSIKASFLITVVIVLAFLTIGTLYSRIMGVPEGSSFGNFSYALYGQVRGGAGWHSAIQELGTRDPGIVYQAALDFFMKHPFSLIIGILKAYRDFFLPGYPNIFPFDNSGQPIWITNTLWVLIMALILFGLWQIFKNIQKNLDSLLLAGFLGIVLSIPFLPPVDGGSRFYASTIAFFFVIPAIGLSKIIKFDQNFSSEYRTGTAIHLYSFVLIFLTLILPIMISSLSNKTPPESFACNSSQNPYYIQIHPDSYINLVQNKNSYCGLVPDVCLNDLLENNTQYRSDDFYQKIYSMTEENEMDATLIPTLNLLDYKFHYFYVDSAYLADDSASYSVSGCATEVKTKYQSIFIVDTFLPIRNNK